MVLFYVAGAADSQEYAVCERLLDIMRMGLPDCQVHKSPVLPSEWPAYSRKLNESWGYVLLVIAMYICTTNTPNDDVFPLSTPSLGLN